MKLKSPLNYKVVKRVKSLDPEKINTSATDSLLRDFKLLLEELVAQKKFLAEHCDDTLEQFRDVVQELRSNTDMNFQKGEDRLDEFYHNLLSKRESCAKLWNVVKLALLLSHGQATVERGFSINKEVSTINLSEHNLISRRIIKDHLKHIGGLEKVVITPEMVTSAAQGRARYQSHLEQRRQEQEKQKQSSKRKATEEQIQQLRKRKKELQDKCSFLNADADKASEEAERKKNWFYVTKANTLRKKAKDLEEQLPTLEKELEEQKTLLANL